MDDIEDNIWKYSLVGSIIILATPLIPVYLLVYIVWIIDGMLGSLVQINLGIISPYAAYNERIIFTIIIFCCILSIFYLRVILHSEAIKVKKCIKKIEHIEQRWSNIGNLIIIISFILLILIIMHGPYLYNSLIFQLLGNFGVIPIFISGILINIGVYKYRNKK